jgi:hypothetical protein
MVYIAGPIVTYKAFLKGKTSSESVPIYFMRWLLCLAVMEYLTHRFPFFAVISSGLLPRLTVAETAVLFYLILKIISPYLAIISALGDGRRSGCTREHAALYVQQ